MPLALLIMEFCSRIVVELPMRKKHPFETQLPARETKHLCYRLEILFNLLAARAPSSSERSGGGMQKCASDRVARGTDGR